jgi:hypothetical protein
MSKERELLAVALEFLDPRSCALTIISSEIQELLAQPEQEPVAWKVIDGTHGGYMFSRIKPTEHTYKYNVVIPLYTSPPKREPLSDGEITTNTPKTIPIGERLAFHAGIRWAEHQHGIGVDDE